MTALDAPPRPVARARPTGPLSERLLAVTDQWARSQHQLVILAAQFADSSEWVIAGSPSPGHWLAAVADVEACTAREWIRIGHKLGGLPVIAAAYGQGRLSYSKVRTLTRIATAANEAELVAIALDTPAGDLGRALAAWLHQNSDPDDLDAHHQQQRSVKWRNEPDGMVTFTLRLPPLAAGALIAWLTTWIMTSHHPATDRGGGASADGRPSVAQQHADAIEALLATEPHRPAQPTAQQHRAADGPANREPADRVPTGQGPDESDEPIGQEPTGHEPDEPIGQEPTDDEGPGGPAGHGRARGRVGAEVIIHIRGDGCSLDDGTPITDTIVERIAPTAFLRALIHDAERRPINASGRQRHPTTRQRRVVKERDQVCCDCGRSDLLHYDHVPDYDTTHHTHIDELVLRCAPCHTRRHAHDGSGSP